ncbi:CNNM domain-containing protein [Phormidesmis sp. 146-33]
MTSLQTFELETAETLVRLSILLLLVIIVALFVAAELAIVSASKSEIYQLSQKADDPRTSKAAQRVHYAQTNLEKYLSVTQTGVTAGSLLLGWLGEGATVHWIEPWISRIPIAHLPVMITSHTIAATIAFLLVTYVEIVLGELVPKVLAAHAPEKTALLLIGPLQICSYLFYPALVVLNGTVKLLTGWWFDRENAKPILPASDTPLVSNDAHSVFVAGALDLHSLNEKLGLNIPVQNTHSTLAGFMIHHLGRMPVEGDRFQWGELEFEAVSIQENRVETILLRQVTRPFGDLKLQIPVRSEVLTPSTLEDIPA